MGLLFLVSFMLSCYYNLPTFLGSQVFLSPEAVASSHLGLNCPKSLTLCTLSSCGLHSRKPLWWGLSDALIWVLVRLSLVSPDRERFCDSAESQRNEGKATGCGWEELGEPVCAARGEVPKRWRRAREGWQNLLIKMRDNSLRFKSLIESHECCNVWRNISMIQSPEYL